MSIFLTVCPIFRVELKFTVYDKKNILIAYILGEVLTIFIIESPS